MRLVVTVIVCPLIQISPFCTIYHRDHRVFDVKRFYDIWLEESMCLYSIVLDIPQASSKNEHGLKQTKLKVNHLICELISSKYGFYYHNIPIGETASLYRIV